MTDESLLRSISMQALEDSRKYSWDNSAVEFERVLGELMGG
jgi:hypothetical protein